MKIQKGNNKWEAVVGLEIHAELKTKSKMFCGCKNDPFNGKANEHTCPVCLAMPGTLPVLNKKAIEDTILTGLALECKVNKFTKWDRKNYFYPDIPKGYQISQFDIPLVYDGRLKIGERIIGITRIHLEEDTATSKHPEGNKEVDYSLIDFNRAGVPLMELVTEPDIRTASEAKIFCKNYQQILKALEIADADMEKGQMRCEANISVRKIGDNKFGTKVEVKNLNSFKSVEKAIKYETERQIDALESGEEIIQQTRGWDEKKMRTYVMRKKETSADYRYFPEPDLPPVRISDKEIEKIRRQIPELPQEKVKRYIKTFKISSNDAETIVCNVVMNDKFKKITKVIKGEKVKMAANFLINEPLAVFIDWKHLVELVELVSEDKISGKIAKDILPEIKKGKSPKQVVKEKGLEQVSDSSSIEPIIDKVIKENSDAVEKIKSGQVGVMGFLVGQIMKETKGTANPRMVNELIRKKIL